MMVKRIFVICFSLLFFFLGKTVAQEPTIYLNNASFEDYPRSGYAPRGWYDCGGIKFPQESPPDIHPTPDAMFRVTKKANDGETYVGMVVRENDSWESIAQRLTAPLQAKQCYSFNIFLSTSKTYESSVRGGGQVIVNFSTPIKLRIWGGTGYCSKKELLAESDLIDHEEWKEYRFKFEPKQRATYIILEAFFKTPTLSPPNGNILLDNASAIVMLPCDQELPLVRKPEVKITTPAREKTVTQKTFDLVAIIANVKKKSKILFKVNGRNNRTFTFNPSTQILKAKVKLREGENVVSIKAVNSAGNAKDQTTIIYERIVAVTPPKDSEPEDAKIIKDLKSLKKGEKIQIDELYFDINSHTITQSSIPVLNDIFDFLQKNGSVKLEVGGHTNRNCDTQYCNELSTNRAKAVVDYLIAKGIRSSRLTFKGYGKTKPLTFSKNAQKKNQRVEIKIL